MNDDTLCTGRLEYGVNLSDKISTGQATEFSSLVSQNGSKLFECSTKPLFHL
jgi:hypothetical protein